jgi:NAD(P)-dependent dehydrogenase (short-subunit alcohol dehydrogenase family)
MMERGGGSIVNVTSVHGFAGFPNHTAYAATKGAINAFTRQLAIELTDRKVRVNAVGPGYVRTDLNSAWLDQPANRDYVLGNTPLGRVGEPADVVGAVTFLASPAAAYVTGQHLRIDGGWSAQ